MSRINNLHAVRVGAALLVVYYHTGFQFAGLQPFGAFSVPLFFVISGFVMAMVATEQPSQFMQRRLLRVIPTYWFCTFVIFLLSVRYPLLFHSTRPHVKWLLESLFFIPFQKAPGIIMPLVFVGWTLNCEMVLYLFIAIGIRFTGKRPVLFASVALVVLMAVCACLASKSPVAFFYSRSTMLSFVLGMGAYTIWKKIETKTAIALRWYAYGILLVCGVGLCVLEGLRIAPYLLEDGIFTARPLLSATGAFLIVMAVVVLAKSGHDIRSNSLMTIADSTYIMYLTHAYVLLMIVLVSEKFYAPLSMNRPAGLMLALTCPLVVAVSAHLWLEKPVMSFLKKLLLTPASQPPRQKMLLEDADGTGVYQIPATKTIGAYE